MKRVLVSQTDIAETMLDEVPAPALGPGQARLRLGRFALTANNVTYAAAGFAIGYWHFFPTGIEGKGLVPVWGFADVVESRSDALTPGQRLYGFFPFAEELVMSPVEAGSSLIEDAAPHRAALPPVYNRYVPSGEKDAREEGLQALLQPLLATSFLLSDWLADNRFFEAKQIIVGSASSKTGLGLCKYLAENADRPVRIVGLTSPGNVGFVEGLGACDQVLSYDRIEDLEQVPSVYVDLAGNSEVKARLHTHLADRLQHSCAVGTSHWDRFQPSQSLVGPKPEFFFAPAQIEKRRADWGPGVIEREIGAAWKRLAATADDWLDLREHEGLEAAMEVYDALVRGHTRPRDGHVISL